MDFTVTFEVQVTAESVEEAGRFALGDLRDEALGPWEATVSCSRGKQTVNVDGNEGILRCAECGDEMFVTKSGTAHHGHDEDEIDFGQDADHVALDPNQTAKLS